jgi:hypothetical protein
MNLEQTALVLTKAQLIDSRVIDKLVLQEWHDLIGDLDFDDAIAAVRAHRISSTDYLMPAHVVQGVAAIEKARNGRVRAGVQSFNEVLEWNRAQDIATDALEAAAREENPVAYVAALLDLDKVLQQRGLEPIDKREHLQALAYEFDHMGNPMPTNLEWARKVQAVFVAGGTFGEIER